MAATKTSVKDRWAALPAKRRQQLALLGVLGGVGLLSFLMLTGTSGTKRDIDPSKLDARVENSLLPDANTRDIGMSGLANDVDAERNARQTLAERLNRMEEIQKQQTRGQEEGGAGRTRDDQLRQQMEGLQAEIAALKANPGTGQAASNNGAEMQGGEIVNAAVTGYGGIRNISNQSAGNDSSGSTSGDATDFSSTDDEEGSESQKQPAVSKMYLPSGSMIEGVMLTGLDAPTGKGALKDPVPVLVRIQKNAILPNRYQADVKECFALIAGQGDLASERAYLRSESISCVRKDKSVIDLNMKAYAVDTDGKAGLRGRLVTKQGSVLSKAILASFADGVAQAFKGDSPSLSLGGDTDIDYGAAANSGAVMGASSSLDRISKYYLDLADQLFPILEIDAGRKVTLVLVRGLEMAPVSSVK